MGEFTKDSLAAWQKDKGFTDTEAAEALDVPIARYRTFLKGSVVIPKWVPLLIDAWTKLEGVTPAMVEADGSPRCPFCGSDIMFSGVSRHMVARHPENGGCILSGRTFVCTPEEWIAGVRES